MSVAQIQAALATEKRIFIRTKVGNKVAKEATRLMICTTASPDREDLKKSVTSALQHDLQASFTVARLLHEVSMYSFVVTRS